MLVLLIALAVSLLAAGSAGAAGVRLSKGTFGSSAQPTFTAPGSITVDRSTGDVLVLDVGRAEEDSLKVAAAAGQFRLTYGGLTTTATATGDTSSATTPTIIKNLSGITGTFTRGESISGAGIPASATILKIVSPTEIEISAPATATATGVALTAGGLPFNISIANLRLALEDLTGLTSGITVTGGVGSKTGSSPYVIKFPNRNAAPLTASNGTTPLSGGEPASEATVEMKVEGANAAIRRFKPDGTPDNFSGLGSNEIDGQRGPGGKTRAECGSAPEPASCDETPQNGIVISEGTSQIAVDNSPGPNQGNVYVTQTASRGVAVFSSAGKYLTQITEYNPDELQSISFANWESGEFKLEGLPGSCAQSSTGPIAFVSSSPSRSQAIYTALEQACGSNFAVRSSGATKGSRASTVEFTSSLSNVDQPQLVCTKLTGLINCPVSTTVPGHTPSLVLGLPQGIAVDSTGAFYINRSESISKYSPAASPPLNADSSINLGVIGSTSINRCSLALGTTSTAGYLFVADCNSGAVAKLNSATGVPQYSFGAGRLVAVDPSTGNPIIAPVSGVATEYETGASAPTGPRSTLTAAGAIQGMAVGNSGSEVYVSRSGSSTLDVFGPVVFQPSANLFAATEITTTKATLNGSVNAEGAAVTSCKFEYLTQAEYAANGNSFSGPNIPQSKSCAESVPLDAGFHPVSAQVSGLKAETAYRFRLAAENGAGPTVSSNKTFTTSSTVGTGQATAVTDTTATLNGTVNPVGLQYTACKFEYLTQSDYAFNGNSYVGSKAPQVKNCSPAAASIETDFQAHAVSAALAGLAKNTTYHFRLSATNGSGTVVGADQTFLTIGQPQIINQVAFVKRTSATLRAWINPSGFATTYHFEWGPSDSYGITIPADTELFVGSGISPVEVSAQISGLTEQTAYHFHVVASSVSGSSKGEDRKFVTLNSHSLPDNRGAEMVSPADKRPTGTVGSIPVADEGQLLTQASDDGNSLIYPLLNGISDSTAGGFLRELGGRGSSGWQSAQVSSPSLVPPPDRNITTNLVNPGLVLWASPDLGCAIVETYNPLTADTPQIDVELGVSNLYRWNRGDGSYELLTKQVPLNPQAHEGFYDQIDASDDCSRIYFHSPVYKFIEGASSGLYEWHQGILRDAGLLPDGSAGAGAVVGSVITGGASPRWNAVSPDGSRLFFSAISDEGHDAGTRAVFMREDSGTDITDISQSQTAISTEGARFEAASKDGSHVFFRANYGIAGTSSLGLTNGNCGSPGGNAVQVETAPCDLYSYDVESGDLTDISADPNTADTSGATAQGLVAISPNGSHAYFAALGRLVPGKGKTYAENNAGLTSANIYLAYGGELSYVTNLGGFEFSGEGGIHGSSSDLTGNSSAPGFALRRGNALMAYPQRWSASTIADGESLLFAASGNITGYASGGDEEAYLFSAKDGKIICISCRPDGLTSVRLPGVHEPGFLGENGNATLSPPLPIQRYQSTALASYRSRSISEDGKRIVFTSPDVLAVGGVAGANNVYEWEEGQVYFLAIARFSGGNGMGFFLDMSADGANIFIATSEQLAPQDIDFVSDAYDLRVDGGFAPEVPVVECIPANDECQGTPSIQPAAPVPASAGFTGPGNSQAGNSGPKHHKKKHHSKKKKHHPKAIRHHSQPTNSNFGGAK